MSLTESIIEGAALTRLGELGYAVGHDGIIEGLATGVIQGRAANGRVDWKTKDGRTLRELQEEEAKD